MLPQGLLMAMQPLVEASDFSAPTPIIIGIVAIVVGLLVIRFVVKTAITVVKIAILVAIGLALYLGVTFIMDAI